MASAAPDTMSPLPGPLLPGFNPDPSGVRVGDDYYVVTSTFEYLPGLPVYRSRDLLAWEHLGNVLDRADQVDLAACPSGTGVWAPTIRHRDDRFYVIVTIAHSPRGCVLFSADDPAGPWSDGITIEGVHGIDPDLAWDDDGNAFITWSDFNLTGPAAGRHGGIVQARADLDAGSILETPRRLWSGTGKTAPEGPHLHRRGDFWYLFIAEGGTGHGHAVSVARSHSIEGPFEGAPGNPVLTASGTDRPVTCTGHADLLEAPDGTDVLLLLATRPIDDFGRFSVLGRETFATGVRWIDGWPVVDAVTACPRPDPVVEHFPLDGSDPFSDPGWLGVRQLPTAADDKVPFGAVLNGHDDLQSAAPAFAGRRQRHLHVSVEVDVQPIDGAGGLALRFDEGASLALLAENHPQTDGLLVSAVVNSAPAPHTAAVAVRGTSVRLRLRATPPARGETPWSQGADAIVLSVIEDDGTERVVLELDGRAWAVETAAPFTGRVVGIVAERGTAAFRAFVYRGEGHT